MAGAPRDSFRLGMIGQVIDGWKVVELLGRGGMGAVYRAEHLPTGGDGAMKVLLAGKSGDQSVGRLKREIELLKRLDHPGIVRALGAGMLAGGRPYYVMELLQGRGLEKIVREGPIPARRAATLVSGIARALGHAHAEGIIHRDVKPTNVMVRPDDTPVVLDFGLAKALFEDEKEQLSVTGQLLGTVSYMSPEQAKGSQLDPSSDVFSLGVILYELLTGKQPFDADSPIAILAAIQLNAPAAPSSAVATIPPALEAICLRALAKTPAERYPDGRAIARDLERFLHGKETAAHAQTRLRRLAIVLAFVAALVVAAVAAALLTRHEPASDASASERAHALHARTHELRVSLRLDENAPKEGAARRLADALGQARPVVGEKGELADEVVSGHVAIAARELQKGDLARARAAADAAVSALAPGDEGPETLAAARGLLLDASGYPKDALPFLEKVRSPSALEEVEDLFPGYRFEVALSHALVTTGRGADALKLLERAFTRADPKTSVGAGVRLARARAKLATKDVHGALKDYEEARAVLAVKDPAAGRDPAFASGYLARAEERFQAHDPKAAGDYRAAVELDRHVASGETARHAADTLERHALDTLAAMRGDATADRVRDAHAVLDLALELDPERTKIPPELIQIENVLCQLDGVPHGVQYLVGRRYRRCGLPNGNDVEHGFFNVEQDLASELARAGEDPLKVATAYRRFSHIVRDFSPDLAYENEEEMRPRCRPEVWFYYELTRGLTLGRLGRIDEGQALVDSALAHARSQLPSVLQEVMFWRGSFESHAQRDEAAVRDLQAWNDYVIEHKLPIPNGWGHLGMATSLHRLGRDSEAEAALRRAHELGGDCEPGVKQLMEDIRLGRK
jgi:hypothetical protein